MGSAFRALFAIISTVGLVASVAAYCGSFFGLSTGSVTNAHGWTFVVMGGIFVVLVPIGVRERVFIKRSVDMRPPWVASALKASGLFAMAHFLLFLILCRAASPEIVDGRYVLSDHGSIRKVLDQAEYLSLVAWEMRFLASFWIAGYLNAALYWWYPQIEAEPNPYED